VRRSDPEYPGPQQVTFASPGVALSRFNDLQNVTTNIVTLARDLVVSGISTTTAGSTTDVATTLDVNGTVAHNQYATIIGIGTIDWSGDMLRLGCF